MNTINIYYDLNLQNSVQTMEPLLIKGTTTINTVLTGIKEDTSKVLYIDIDYGDGSAKVKLQRPVHYNYRQNSIFNELRYGKIGGSICLTTSHVYSNTDNINYGKQFITSFLFLYSDGREYRIIQPVTVFWGSFYDDIKELVAINTQIQPTIENNSFVNLESTSASQLFPCILP